MLQRLDKFAPYALILILGYLTYTTVEEAGTGLIQQKSLPEITPGMLAPTLIEPTAHASPVGRDPFEVDWASYQKDAGVQQATSQPATTQPATQPATPVTTQPAPIPPPALPGRLSGVFLGQGLRIAVIGQRIYKVGSIIGGSDPRSCWRIEAIESKYVVIGFGSIRHILRITGGPTEAGPAHRAKSR